MKDVAWAMGYNRSLPAPGHASWGPALHLRGLVHRCCLSMLHHRILGRCNSWWHHWVGRAWYSAKCWVRLLAYSLKDKGQTKYFSYHHLVLLVYLTPIRRGKKRHPFCSSISHVSEWQVFRWFGLTANEEGEKKTRQKNKTMLVLVP